VTTDPVPPPELGVGDGVGVGVGGGFFRPAEEWCTARLTGLVAVRVPVARVETPVVVAVGRVAGVECGCVLVPRCTCLAVERGGTTIFSTGPEPEPDRECEPGPEPRPIEGR
jgi:hypothetical protein